MSNQQMPMKLILRLWTAFIVAVALTAMGLLVYAVSRSVRFDSIAIGSRRGELVTTSSLWGRGTRALFVVSDPNWGGFLLSRRDLFVNQAGIHLNGRLVRRWDKSFIVLVGVNSQGKPVLYDVSCDKPRLQWLRSDDPQANSSELQRLDSDCSLIEQRVKK